MKMTMMIAGVCLGALSLFADTLLLRDGKRIEGTFLGATSREIRFAEGGRAATRYDVRDVDSIQFGSSVSSGRYSTSGTSDRSSDRYSTDQDQRYHSSSISTDDPNRIPAGTVFTVRMIDAIDSNATDAGQTFRASLDEPVVINGRTVGPVGADALVRVAKVRQASGVSGSEEVTLELAEVNIDSRRYNVTSGPAEVASKSRGSQSVKVIGGTAVLGAIIGGIAGGGRGAAIGAAAGAGTGAAIQAVRGQRVQVPSESKLDFTLTNPIQLNR